jgi:preprotein translocase subunit YajC
MKAHCPRCSPSEPSSCRSCAESERSVLRAYVALIRAARRFIYIENQFFISNADGSPRADDPQNTVRASARPPACPPAARVSVSRRQSHREATAGAPSRSAERVITTSGIYGTVANVDREADRVALRVDEAGNVKIAVTVSSIAKVLGDSSSPEP